MSFTMIIGIDASRATLSQKTGTENYSYNLILSLLRLDQQNDYVLYLRENWQISENSLGKFSTRIINLPILWTQVGLALEVTLRPPDLLFIPAHTIPIIRPPELKTIMTIHDLGYEYLEAYHKFPQHLYLNKSTEFGAKFATHLIAVSEATKKDLVARLSANPDKVSVVYEGYDKELFYPRKRKEVAEIKKKYHLGDYLLFVGTVQPRKNLLNLIKAYALAYDKVDIDLVIIGKKGWLSEEIYKLPSKIGLDKKVRFMGFIPSEELPPLYCGAKALVFPSLYEGFGLPILEAFASGVPVLTSNISSMPEIAGESALLVDPYDIESISRGILQITSNNYLRDQLIGKGLRRVKSFTWEETAKKTLEVFNKIIYGR